MNKRDLLWISLGAIGLLVLGTILWDDGHRGIAGPINLLGLGLWLIAWVLGIILAARASQWFWFILIVFFTPLATLLYGLFGGGE